MSNRSRRERRAAQAQRAIESGDTQAFAALGARDPAAAALQVERALSGLAAEIASPLDDLAGDLCFRLRRTGRLPAARQLARACEHRSTRLRLESALSSFALGEDDEVARVASADPRVAAVVAPLLDASRAAGARQASANGAPAAKAEGKPWRAADSRPAALRALHDAAAAAKATALGQVGPARTTLRKVPAEQRGLLLAQELSAAIDLAKGSGNGRRRAVQSLVRSAAVRESPPAREALVACLAAADPAGALAAAKELGLAQEALRPLQIRALAGAGTARGASPVQAALELARTAGAQLFDPPHRGAASLYEGFACLDSDPKRAGRAFDRAIELGGDMLEALRGKLLLAGSTVGEVCPDCGGHHHDSNHQGREVGAAADRFARAARRVPSGAPFAVAASLLAARAWDDEGDTKAASAALEVARAESGGAMADELDLREAHVVARQQPARAAALLDALIARDPRDARAWRMKIELARDADDEAGATELELRAATATGDPELTARARALRLRRGELAPFQDLPPGATAGALAAEAAALLGAPGPSPELPAGAIAGRAALGRDGQLAFDAALLHIEVSAGKRDAAVRRLAPTLETWWGSPAALARLAGFTWLLELEEHLAPAARALVYREGAGPAMAALFDAARAARDAEVAEAVLKVGSVCWSRAEIQERRRLAPMRTAAGGLLRSADARSSAAPDPTVAGHAIQAALAPEFRIDLDDLDDRLDELDELEERGDVLPELSGMNLEGILDSFLGLLGLSKRELQSLSPAKMQQLLEHAERITRGPPSPAKLEGLRTLARRLAGKR